MKEFHIVPFDKHMRMITERDLKIASQAKHINSLEYELQCMREMFYGGWAASNQLKAENKALKEQLEHANKRVAELEERKIFEKTPLQSQRDTANITSYYSRTIRENIRNIFEETEQNREGGNLPIRKWDWFPREIREFLLDCADYMDSLEALAGIGMAAKNVDAISRKELLAKLEQRLNNLPPWEVSVSEKAWIYNIITLLKGMKSVEYIVGSGGKCNG